MQQSTEQQLVVYCAGVSWDDVRGTDRQVAMRLARYARVLWVDTPLSAFRLAQQAGVSSRAALVTPAGVRRMREHLAERHRAAELEVPGLIRVTPVAAPGLTRPGVRASTRVVHRATVRSSVRRLGMPVSALVVSCYDDVFTSLDGVRPQQRPQVKVLYGLDDFTAGVDLMHLDPRRVRRQEQAALRASDVRLAVSHTLQQRWDELGVTSVLLPNGVDDAFFAQVDAATPPTDLPDLSGRGPVVGVVGQLGPRLDLDVLEALAASGMTLLLVGPVVPRWGDGRFDALVRRPNVYWVGRRPFEQLPSYLRVMDVGLTPYLDTAFNRASDPLKTLEYLAAGLPTVSTDLPAARALEPSVTLARSPGEFVAAVRAVAPTRFAPDSVARRREVAHQNSWDVRAAALAAILGISGPDRYQEAADKKRTGAEQESAGRH